MNVIEKVRPTNLKISERGLLKEKEKRQIIYLHLYNIIIITPSPSSSFFLLLLLSSKKQNWSCDHLFVDDDLNPMTNSHNLVQTNKQTNKETSFSLSLSSILTKRHCNLLIKSSSCTTNFTIFFFFFLCYAMLLKLNNNNKDKT